MTKPTITLTQIKTRVDEKVFERGQSYFYDGMIFDTVMRGNDIEAKCEGSDYEPYRVRVIFHHTNIVKTSCTCAYDWGGDCKHIVALLLTYYETPEVFEQHPSIDAQLEQYTKADLKALIKDMIHLYPDLQDLLDNNSDRRGTIVP